MKKKAKEFDCVEMQHRAALRIYEETKDLTQEERLAYWQQRNEDARIRMETARRDKLDPDS